MSNEREKAVLGAQTIKAFLDQFGESEPITRTFIEVLLEELMNAKIVSIFGESKQTRDKDNNMH